MKVIGHTAIVRRLRDDVPQVSLFLGPKSVGRMTTAMWTVDRLGVPWSDVLIMPRLFTHEDMEKVTTFARRRGSTERGQVLIIRLSALSVENRPQLMKVLEEPGRTRFILISEDPQPHAVTTRAKVYRFGLLSQEHVAKILIARGANEGEAHATAQYSAGAMDILWLAKQVTEVKPLVQQVLRAFHARDAATLEMLAPRWSEVATQWLARWCAERSTGRWRWFNSDFSEIEDSKTALRILVAISEDVRPALVVRSSLMTMIKEA